MTMILFCLLVLEEQLFLYLLLKSLLISKLYDQLKVKSDKGPKSKVQVHSRNKLNFKLLLVYVEI